MQERTAESRHLASHYPKDFKIRWKRADGRAPDPYVDFAQIAVDVTRTRTNAEDPVRVERVFRFNLENTAGTLAQVMRYCNKGWDIIGYGNLSVNNASQDVAMNHLEIKVYCDRLMDIVEKADFATLQAEKTRLAHQTGIEEELRKRLAMVEEQLREKQAIIDNARVKNEESVVEGKELLQETGRNPLVGPLAVEEKPNKNKNKPVSEGASSAS